jgi:hypothetical protein
MVKRGFGSPVYLAAGLLMAVTTVRGQENESGGAKADAGVAAYVGGKPITMTEVDEQALGTNMKLAQQLYDERSKALDQMILERVLGPKAAEVNQTVDEYIRARLAEAAAPVTDAEVEAFFNSNQGRMRGKTLEQMSGQIRSFLVGQQQTTAREKLVDEAKKEAGVRVVMEVPRVKLAIAANAPAKGPAGAKVTVVEYSEFQ